MEQWIGVGKHLFIDYEKSYVQLEKENWKVFDSYVVDQMMDSPSPARWVLFVSW